MWWNWSSCTGQEHYTRLVINVDTVQKELIKSQKRKKKKITMLLCWIRRVVMAQVVLFILCVGGVQLKNVLIDSGATCNIVDRATWESLKQKGVKCKSRKCEKKLFAYGQTKAIEVVGTFESEIHCEESGEKCMDEFTVVEGRGKALLGKDTAEKLNVLRVGPLTHHKHAQSQVRELLWTLLRTLLMFFLEGVN